MYNASQVGTHCFFLDIDGRIHEIHILLIQFLPQQLHSLAEPLEMNDLPLPQEPDHIVYIRIIRKTQNVVISGPRLLFWERIA